MNSSFSGTSGETEENINSKAAGILGLLSDVNLTKIKWQMEDTFTDALEVYPLKFSSKKLFGWGLFHLLTGLSLLPAYIFFPVLRKTLLFDPVPHPKHATHFLVRSAGYLFHVRRRLYNELGKHSVGQESLLSRVLGQFVLPQSVTEDGLSYAKFEHDNILYFFDEVQKAFRVCGGDLSKYSSTQIKKLVDVLHRDTTQNTVNFGDFAGEELVVFEDVCFQHSLKHKDKSSSQLRSLWLLIFLNTLNMILYLFHGALTLFAVASASTLFTLVFLFVPKFLGSSELPEGLNVRRVTSRGQVQQLRINQSELQIGDLLTFEPVENESLLARFQGILISGKVFLEGQTTQLIEQLPEHKQFKTLANAHQSLIQEGDLLVIERQTDPCRMLVLQAPTPHSGEQSSRKQLTDALTRTVYFLFIPLWCINSIYYVMSGVPLASLWGNILVSFCPFLIFAPFGPEMVSGLRKLFGERTVGSDSISVDDHNLDLILERPKGAFDVSGLKINSAVGGTPYTIKLHTKVQPHIPDNVPSTLKSQIVANKISLEHPAICESWSNQHGTEHTENQPGEGFVPTLRILTHEHEHNTIRGYQCGEEAQIEEDFKAGFSRRYISSEFSVCFKLAAKKSLASYKTGHKKHLAEYNSSTLIHPVDTVFDSWACPWLFQFCLIRSSNVVLLDIHEEEDNYHFISVSGTIDQIESSGTPSSSSKSTPTKSVPTVLCKKITVDRNNPDPSLLSLMMNEAQSQLHAQNGEFIISGTVLKVFLEEFPHLAVDRLCITQIAKSRCHFVDVSKQTIPTIQRFYLRTGKLVEVQDKERVVKDLAESRLCFSVGVAIFKMICSISLMELTTANFLTQAKSTLSERQLLCPYILVLLPMMIVSVFTKRQLFLIDEGTKKFFRHERLVISVFGNYLIQLAFQNLMMKALRNQFFYIDPLIYNLSDHSTFDNASLFKLNLFLSLGTVAAYSIEDPFKSNVWKNRLFGLLIAYELAAIMTLTWSNSVGSSLFGVAALPLFFNTVVLVIGFLSMLAVITFEDKIVNRSIIWQFFDRVFH